MHMGGNANVVGRKNLCFLRLTISREEVIYIVKKSESTKMIGTSISSKTISQKDFERYATTVILDDLETEVNAHIWRYLTKVEKEE